MPIIWTISHISLNRSTEGGLGAPAGDTLNTGENGEIVGGPRTPQQIAAQKRLQQTQAQVDEVCNTFFNKF